MTTADNAPPTWGLRLGAVSILISAQGDAVAEIWQATGWLSLSASLLLVTPAVRWRRSSRRYTAWTACGWFTGGWLLLMAWPISLLVGSMLPFGLLFGSMVALIGCGVGWGNEEELPVSPQG